MATLIPRTPPLPGPGRAAELALYEALRRSLPDDFYVYHSLHFIDRAEAREGEADFVLLQRTLGMLVIECKGHGVRRDGTGQWHRVLSKDTSHPMENPVHQAQRHIKALVAEFRVRMDPAPPRFPFVHGHAVAFPFHAQHGGSLRERRGGGRRAHRRVGRRVMARTCARACKGRPAPARRCLRSNRRGVGRD